MDSLPHSAVAHTAFVFGHLLAVLVAAAGVCFADFAVFAGRRIDAKLLSAASGLVVVALGALWATGLILVGLDTGFDPAVIVTKSKLLAKLTVVTVLTLNGIALHHYAFPQLVATKRSARLPSALMPTLLGALSTGSWLYALFVASSKPLAASFAYRDYLALYALALAGAAAFAMLWVRPLLAQRLQQGASSGRSRPPAQHHEPSFADSLQPG